MVVDLNLVHYGDGTSALGLGFSLGWCEWMVSEKLGGCEE